jgi:hypothetical protein
MPSEPNSPLDPKPMALDQLLAEMLRENERLRRQVADANHDRDTFKRLFYLEAAKNDPEFTAEDIAEAVPARPFIDQLISRLEKR